MGAHSFPAKLFQCSVNGKGFYVMATSGKRDKEDLDQSRREYRELIGQAIIGGLLNPGNLTVVEDYNQGSGGYWQGPGEGHAQGSGDYHQGVAKA
jgi:hypothetical protein